MIKKRIYRLTSPIDFREILELKSLTKRALITSDPRKYPMDKIERLGAIWAGESKLILTLGCVIPNPESTGRK